jgi:hypothetical protein
MIKASEAMPGSLEQVRDTLHPQAGTKTASYEISWRVKNSNDLENR